MEIITAWDYANNVDDVKMKYAVKTKNGRRIYEGAYVTRSLQGVILQYMQPISHNKIIVKQRWIHPETIMTLVLYKSEEWYMELKKRTFNIEES